MFKLALEKAEEPEIKLPTSAGSSKKQESSRKTSISALFVRLYFLGSKITADGDCSHGIKRRLLLGRKVMTNLDSIWKCRDITLPTKVCLVKAKDFPGGSDGKASAYNAVLGAGVRHSTHGKGHEEGGSTYAKGGSSLRSPPWKSLSIYPHNQSLPTLLLCTLTYTSDFTGVCPPPPLSEKKLT